ncbi:MAG: hypothetical protein U5K31_03555 [Balneolaceae bacterium]|nr:hypothetical protein [Balneolaceae bacterium]
MKTLQSIFLLSFVILLSGCYTQLKYQQSTDRYSSDTPSHEVSEERSQERAAEKRSDVRRDDRRGSKIGYYYMSSYSPFDTWYGGNYGNYYRAGWSGYGHYDEWRHGYGPYYSDWKWRSYMSYRFKSYRGPWFSFGIGYGSYYPYHDRWFASYPFHSWRYNHGYWGNTYYNNYYFLDDDFAWYDDDRGSDVRYGLRSLGTSRLDAGGAMRGNSQGVRSSSRYGSADASSNTGRIRGGSSGTTRSTGSVNRTRSGGSSRSGTTGSGSTTRKRGGNDDGVQVNRDSEMQRSRDGADEVIRYRSLSETSRSTDAVFFPTVDPNHRTGEMRRVQRMQPLFRSGYDFSRNTEAFQDRLRSYRVETVQRPETRERKGFLQRLGEFFESNRSSYEHIWDSRGDRGGYTGNRGRDSGSSGSRGSVGRGSDSSGSDGRSRSSGGSRSRGSGGGDDDGSSRSRGGN